MHGRVARIPAFVEPCRLFPLRAFWLLPPQTDIDWINKLASTLSSGGLGEALESLAELLIAEYIVAANPSLTHAQKEDAISEELNERLRSCRSDAFAAELFAMAANNDPDFDGFLFPDGRGEMIFIAGAAIEAHAECLLERYVDYIDTYPDYDLIHPSDFSGPRETDEDKESERLIRDFSFMLREWRDDFLCKLIEDCAAKASDS